MLIETVRSDFCGHMLPPSQISLPILELTAREAFGDRYVPSFVYFVDLSQKVGYWAGAIWQNKSSSAYFAEMIERGVLSETRVENGWLYQLTEIGIRQIFSHQQKHLEHQAKDQGSSNDDSAHQYFFGIKENIYKVLGWLLTAEEPMSS